jgi:parallel beta-helix repeat protein
VQQAYASTTASSSSSCISYNSLARVITISCGSTDLTDIHNKLDHDSILSKQSDEVDNNVWLLNASLVISKGAAFHIDSTDTKWLKLISDGTNLSGIRVHGSLRIDSVKITSWNPITNSYSTTSGTPEHPGLPRPFIRVEKDATVPTNITNSEIAYLGYGGKALGLSHRGAGVDGVAYYGGDGSILRGNNIHDNWFGFYSDGVGGLLLENNKVYNNNFYGFDPHTGSHEMIIRNNKVHDNGSIGIICSLNCYNVTIENNEVYHNGQSGIMFSRNMSNSIVRNNNVHNEVKGIFISQSHNNKIDNNTVSDSEDGILVKFGSSRNMIDENTIINSKLHGIFVNSSSSENRFYSNIVKNSVHYGIYAEDPASVNNVFYNNQLINSSYAINPHNKIYAKSVNIPSSSNH